MEVVPIATRHTRLYQSTLIIGRLETVDRIKLCLAQSGIQFEHLL